MKSTVFLMYKLIQELLDSPLKTAYRRGLVLLNVYRGRAGMGGKNLAVRVVRFP